MVTGAWQATGTGYAVTLRLRLPDWGPRGGDRLGFDLLVNEMHPGPAPPSGPARLERRRRVGLSPG